MKRTVCIVLALIMALALCFALASCGEKKEGVDYLVLVNKENKLPDDWEQKLEIKIVKNSFGDDVEVEKEACTAYMKLKEALAAENVYIDLDSARRSVAEQQKIWGDFTRKYGEDYTKRYVAAPGYSEHHTGLALDLYLNIDGNDVYENEDMVEYPEIWDKIHEKLAEYGFVLRYLEGKESVTGYGYEPWHIRYVGDAKTAKEITDKGITLEEYLNKLPVTDVTPPADEEEEQETEETEETEETDDGQNPVMNFIGPYESGRARATVEADGMKDAKITIEWSNSAFDLRKWEIKGEFDLDTLTVNYEDAVVTDVAYNSDGEIESEETVSENDAGSVAFNGETLSFIWNDGLVEQEDMEFVWAFSTES